MADEKQMDRLAKLLGLAKDASNEHEAELAREKLYQFLADWQVEMADVIAHAEGRQAGDRVIDFRLDIASNSTYFKCWATVACNIVEGMGGSAFINMTGTNKGYVQAYAYEGDAVILQALHGALVAQGAIGLSRYLSKEKASPSWTWYTASNKYNLQRSFIMGFGTEIKRKMVAARNTAVQDHGSSRAELVLTDRRALVRKQMELDNPALRKTKMQGLLQPGYDAGVAHGRQTDIGQTKLGDTGRQAIG